MTPDDYCHHLAVQQGSDFRYSLLGLPLAQRQILVAVHAFQVETTRIVDDCRDIGVARTGGETKLIGCLQVIRSIQ